jgi:hypothetical protein
MSSRHITKTPLKIYGPLRKLIIRLLGASTLSQSTTLCYTPVQSACPPVITQTLRHVTDLDYYSRQTPQYPSMSYRRPCHPSLRPSRHRPSSGLTRATRLDRVPPIQYSISPPQPTRIVTCHHRYLPQSRNQVSALALNRFGADTTAAIASLSGNTPARFTKNRITINRRYL